MSLTKKRNLKQSILDLKSKGLNNFEISKELNCSGDTVYYHLNPDYIKLKREKRNIVRNNNKLKLVELHGSKCKICSYDKTHKALQFHHLNPKEKSFTIGANKIQAIDKIIEESNKCLLVCANCHAEIEAGLINLENFHESNK